MRRQKTIIGLIVMCANLSAAQGSSIERPTTVEEAGVLAEARARMVESQVEARGVTDSATLDAMRVVPRHRFVPLQHRERAYGDYPLPIGEGQTISQPFIVGAMTEALELSPEDRVLEIGTGSGYQAAVLAEIVREVYTIEIVQALGEQAESTLAELQYGNVHVRIGDGYRGWPEQAPFAAIILTAAPDHVPQPLIDQLAMGGRMVLPLGTDEQSLVVLTRTPEGMVREERFGVRFVPMTGEAMQSAPDSVAAPSDSTTAKP